MTVSKLNDYAIKIYLDKADIEKYDISCSNINSRTVRRILSGLYGEITEILPVEPDYDRLYVEVFSQKNSCLIFVSCIGNKSTAAKFSQSNMICQFDTFESLKSFCRTAFLLYPRFLKKSALYSGQSTIRLSLKLCGNERGVSELVNEYGTVIPATKINKAVTKEYFSCVAPDNAIEKILDIPDKI